MTVHRFFGKPQFHDADFYKDREVSDHIHEQGHRGRVLRALHDVLYLLDFDPKAKTVGDFGCGSGGLLWQLNERVNFKAEDTWGYDLSPKATEFAAQKYKVNAQCMDFTNGSSVRIPDIAVLTETLEHLVDPPAFLAKLKNGGVRWVVASCPLFETPENHYEYHLWAWDGEGFKKMFRDAGYFILAHYGMVGGACQHVIALNREALKEPLPYLP